MRDHACSAASTNCPHLQQLRDAERQLRTAADITRKLMVQVQDLLDLLSAARQCSSIEQRSLSPPMMYGNGSDHAGRLRPIMALTPREAEILSLIADGDSNRAIADRLFLSPRTVERHIANLYLKLDIHNKAEAIDYVRRHGRD